MMEPILTLNGLFWYKLLFCYAKIHSHQEVFIKLTGTDMGTGKHIFTTYGKVKNVDFHGGNSFKIDFDYNFKCKANGDFYEEPEKHYEIIKRGMDYDLEFF